MEVITKYRDMMFSGKLFMPKIAKLKTVYGEKVYGQIQNMFEATWYAYLNKGEEGTISSPYWAKRIKNPTAMNIALNILSKKGWLTSKSLPNNNWAEISLNESKLLEYMTETELASVRKQFKFSKYILNLEDEAKRNNLTRLNGKVGKTGIVREGFRRTSNTQFRFDTTTMDLHRESIVKLINKGIDKMTEKHPQISNDLANYGEIGTEIVDHYIWNEGLYSAGQNNNDSRGRNISGMLNKIGNPIGFKVMRSLLVIPEEVRNVATKNGLRNKYLFIAELLGYKKGNVAGKVNFGRRAYFEKRLIENIKIDDLFENIWLDRIYNELDFILDMDNWKKTTALARYKVGTMSMTAAANKIETFNGSKWYVPVEIDMSASILGIMGLLLNHKPFMERTNMIGSTIGDAWHHDVITNRLQFKTIMRVCYGSGMSPDKMWNDMKIPYTVDEVNAFEIELETGEVAVANKFKDFIIHNAKPQVNMKLKIDKEEFNVECNRYFNIGETTNKFDLYDTYSNSIRRIHNTDTVKRPDLKSFKRFFVTGLIHNLDSQVEDNTVNEIMESYGWAIDIHDAVVLCCEAVDYARDVYCSGTNPEQPSLERIHRERKNILGQYFTSIGIKSTKMSDWKTDVKDYIEPYKGKLCVNRIVLK